jgi:hypothetical protein
VELVDLAVAVVDSHFAVIGEPLPLDPAPAGPHNVAAALYSAPFAVLAHDAAADPRFVYANLTAQRLWRRDWSEFVGLPSRLSAEPDEREARQRMLEAVARDGYIDDYAGIRVDAAGGRFRISGARLWNVWVGDERVGQAVAIPRWAPLPG